MPTPVPIRPIGSCACGGGCPRCQSKSPLQAKLAVSEPGDMYEREADRVADEVTRMPASSIQRKPSPFVSLTPYSLPLSSLSLGPGRPLDPATRNFFEPRFGYNFGGVRVHTGEAAAESARAAGALAYTVGSDIVFARGQSSGGIQAGSRLLAHELAHVAQQRAGVLQRAPDPAALAEFDDRVAKLRAHPAFVAVKDPDAKRELREILAEARKRDNALYYIEKLELLFNTAEEKRAVQADETIAEMVAARSAESARLATTEGQAGAGREEAVARDPSRVFTPRTGQEGATFLIDARDVTDIAVRAKVRLVAEGKGTKVDVGNVATLEDAIEKRSATLGYSVDLDFVDKPGKDVFTVGVDPSDWPTSGNWVRGAEVLSHELHHLLGLDDLYDYIERHAGNPKMRIPARIHWFRVQMDKTPDPQAGKSIMGQSTTGGRNLPSDEDVCRVAGAGPADFDACVEKRAEARRAALQPAVSRAFVMTFRAYELLSNSRPANPAEDIGLRDLKRRRAAGMALNVFGAPVSLSFARDVFDDMRFALAATNLYLVSELEPQCSQTAFTVAHFPRIRLCPAFLGVATAVQADLLLREAAHFVGASDGTADAPCSGSDCADPCGDSNNAEAWARFVKCVAGIA
jgi:hypothetical protein